MKHKIIIFSLVSFCLVLSLTISSQARAVEFLNVTQKSLDRENELGFFVLTSVKIGYSHVLSSVTLKNTAFPITFDKTDSPTFAIGLAGSLGYKFTSMFGMRTELEFIFRAENEMDADVVAITPTGVQSGVAQYNVTIGTLLTNFYLDFYVTNQIALYTGLGVGVSLAQQSAPGFPHDVFSDIRFSWNVSAGTMITVLDSLVFDIGVRYSHFGTIDNGSEILSSKNKLQAIEVLAGISYKF